MHRPIGVGQNQPIRGSILKPIEVGRKQPFLLTKSDAYKGTSVGWLTGFSSAKYLLFNPFSTIYLQKTWFRLDFLIFFWAVFLSDSGFMANKPGVNWPVLRKQDISQTLFSGVGCLCITGVLSITGAKNFAVSHPYPKIFLEP